MGAIDESDVGDREPLESRQHKSTCQETKKGENNQGTSINIPAAPEVINREKAIHTIHTLLAGSIQASRWRQANLPASRAD